LNKPASEVSISTPGSSTGSPPVSIPLPEYAVPEIVADVDFDDERLWVPRGDNVESLPLLFSVTQGSWVNITRARGDGIISRHRHSSPVTGYTLGGAWGYLEHDWTARKGTFVYEPPGETHTLVVKPDPQSDAPELATLDSNVKNKGIDHMMVLFHNFGPLMHVDNQGEVTGYVDVFTRLESCKSHYTKCGLGSDFIERLIR